MRIGTRAASLKTTTTGDLIVTAWILVADSSRAKLFTTELPEQPWTMLKEFSHPEGREPSREIHPSSPPGRMLQNKAKGGRRSAMEPRTTPKEAEMQRFAQRLSDFLEAATAKRDFDGLVVVAPPHFLGVLHGALGAQTVKCLRATIDKDLSMLDTLDVRKRLLDVVFPASKGTAGE
jgi:protein required for attachment to host cells